MSKKAEKQYALQAKRSALLAKPYNKPREFREFATALQLFRERLEDGGRILDLGCGPGWTSHFLARGGYEVAGVDISERMIEVARERCVEDQDVEFVVGDMEALDLQQRDFDGVLCFDCLHHCPRYQKVLDGACAHLRPGGVILLMETTWLHRYSPHAREATRQHGVTELGFSKRQLRRGLRQAGFVDVTFYHDSGPCYSGITGFLMAGLRLVCDYFLCYPQAKNIVLARKPD